MSNFQIFRSHHILEILSSYDQSRKPLDILLSDYFRTHKAIGSKDRTFIYETIYSMIRWKSLLEWYTTPPVSWNKIFNTHQNHSIEELQTAPNLPITVKLSTPEWLWKKIFNEYGEEKANEICIINNTQAPLTIRTNLIKISRDELFMLLSKHHEVYKTKLSPLGITFAKRVNFFTLPEFKQGLFEVQDEGSQLLSFLVEPKVGDQILDYCAGSGGKTLAFASKTKGKGQIYLHDIRKMVLLEAKKRLKRAGIQNGQILNPEEKLHRLKKKCNWVFVDVPCSGTGTIRRNPEMKWRLKEDEIVSLVETQRAIFAKALSYLTPDGKIVYGTCSILREENEEQVEYFKEQYQLQAVGAPLKILPSIGGADGFFGVILCQS